MNGERISFSNPGIFDQNDHHVPLLEGTNTHFLHTFKNFLKDFARENTRLYHRQLDQQNQKKKYVLSVELGDLKAFDESLYDRIISTPLEMLRVM